MPTTAEIELHPTDHAARQRRILWVILLAVIVLTIGTCRIAITVRLEHKLAEIRERGEVVDMEEFWLKYNNATQTGPDSNEVYERALSLRQDIPEADKNLVLVFSYKPLDERAPYPPEVLDASRRHLEAHKEMLRLFDEADNITAYNGSVSRSPDGDIQFSGLGAPRQIGKWRLLQAYLAAAENDGDRATEALIKAWKMGDRLDHAPSFLITQLVKGGVRADTVKNIHSLMLRVEFTDAQLRRLIETIQASDLKVDWVQTLLMERLTCIHYSKNPDTLLAFSPPTIIFRPGALGKAAMTGYSISGMAEMDRLAMLDHFERVLKIAKLPSHEALDEINKISIPDGRFYKLTHPLMSLLSTEWDRYFHILARQDVQVHTALVALTVERYRLAEGNLPERLDEVVPRFLDAVPTDPYTGQPLLYRKLDGGYVVYSVGQDKTDNGGSEAKLIGSDYPPGSDIVFRVEKP